MKNRPEVIISIVIIFLGMLGFFIFFIMEDMGVTDSICQIFGFSGLGLFCLGYFILSIVSGFSPDGYQYVEERSEIPGMVKKTQKDAVSSILRYIKSNKTHISLFTRPSSQKLKLVLANKFLILEIDVNKLVYGNREFVITDKTKGEKHIYRILNLSWLYGACGFFTKLVEILDYETQFIDIIDYLNESMIDYEQAKMQKLHDIALDINQASEAELTAIPGVTIAKAKHAIKVRNKQKLFLTMNQFYQTVNLEEKFIEQIPVKGNKILLKELPEYKMLEMKKEE